MAEPSKGGEPRELSMELRLLLAFILMGAVLFLTPYFYRSEEPPATPQPAPAQVEQPAESPAAEAAAEPAAPVETPPQPTEAISAQQEEELVIETDVYRIAFSNRGAVVHSWVLTDFEDSAGKPLELVNSRAVEKVGYPFGIVFPDDRPVPHPNDVLFVATRTEDGLGIDFEYSDGSIVSRKSFRFEQARYLFEVSSEMLRGGRPAPHLLAWRGGFGDTSVQNAHTELHSLFYDLSQNKLIVNDAGDAEGGRLTQSGNYSFAGVEDKYFAAVALPENGSSFEIRTFADGVVLPDGERTEAYVGAALGGRGENTFPMYVGPKDLDLLKAIDPRLQQVVDFGFFAILAKPLFLAMRWVHDHWIPSYGWSIVFLTVAINFLTVPLKLTSLKSMRKMQAIQPLIKELNDKYKGISIRDPKKSQQNEEMMALYKKHGVNPMGGCIPMILQIPFFFAFYKVLSVAIELRGADWLWVTDLSQPETLPIRVLPVVMVISQFAMQKISPTSPSVDPNQQRMMQLMPLMFGFFFYGVSSGLVLYWLTSNVVGVAQQLAFNRFFASDTPVVEAAPAAKSKKKRSGKSR